MILQARQLQRIAIESMLICVERAIGSHAMSSDELTRVADEAAKASGDIGNAVTLGQYLGKVADEEEWPRAAGDGSTDLVSMLNDIHSAQTRDPNSLPGHCLRAYALIHAVAIAAATRDVPEGFLDPQGGGPTACRWP